MKWTAVAGAGVAFLLFAGGWRAYGAPPADPCSLLTAPQVSAALGAAASEGKRVATSLCQWDAPGRNGGTQKVSLTLGNAQRFAMAKMPINDPRITKTPVSGIGDEAVYGTTAGQAASINVKKGDAYFAISVNGVPMEQAQATVTTLAKEVVSKMQ